MKNFNLIERLWTDSHEKQRVRGMRRYAAMITLLLTIIPNSVQINMESPASGLKNEAKRSLT